MCIRDSNFSVCHCCLMLSIFVTLARDFNTSGHTSVCVSSTEGQEDIKKKLTEACSADDRVHIAKRYCIEERNGAYFCLKDGKCIGRHCMGCVRHECEVNGTR